MNVYIKFGENMLSGFQDIEGKRNFGVNQGPKFWYKVGKMMCNNPKVDHVNINAYTKMVKFYTVFLKVLRGNKIMTDRRTE